MFTSSQSADASPSVTSCASAPTTPTTNVPPLPFDFHGSGSHGATQPMSTASSSTFAMQPMNLQSIFSTKNTEAFNMGTGNSPAEAIGAKRRLTSPSRTKPQRSVPFNRVENFDGTQQGLFDAMKRQNDLNKNVIEAINEWSTA